MGTKEALVSNLRIGTRWSAQAVCAALLLAAVSVSGQETRPAKPEAAKPDVAKVPETGAGVDPTSFVIGPEDVLFIRVWRDNDFSGPAVVRPDGRITMPLIGEIPAAGSTPAQLGGVIAEKLVKYINKPDVTVIVQSVNSKKYYITGEVNSGGAFPLVVKTTVLEALGKAGGFREFANVRKIVILRNGKRIPFNYKEVTQGKKMEQNIILEPGDYIIVP